MTEFGAVQCPPYTFHSSRAKYPGNIQFYLKPDLTIELQNLYMREKIVGGGYRQTADKR